jgi:hypothetical protein
MSAAAPGDASRPAEAAGAAGTRPSRAATIALLVICGVVGLGLRLEGIGTSSLSHVEVYAPGIDLVPGISEPPPRHEFDETLSWHFHDEPHPIGYYLAMFGWTSAFGDSAFALRLPGAILGTLSIGLIFLLADRLYGRPIGLLAAVLLTLHGFHVHWSQMARMYVPGALIALAATLLLVMLAGSRTRRPGLEIAYVLVALAGVQTVELFWPVLALHTAWTALVVLDDARFTRGPLTARGLLTGPRLAQVQAVALALCAPALSHAAYRGREGAAPSPSLEFLREYFSFGFVFARDPVALPALEPPALVAAGTLVIALGLLGLSLRARPVPGPPEAADRSVAPWIRIGAAVAASALMLWLASIAHRRNAALAALSILPLLALAVPGLSVLAARGLGRLPLVRRVSPWTALLWLLAVVAPLALFVASIRVSVAAPRAFLIFVPFMLVLCAAGLGAVARRPAARVPAFAALSTLFLAGALYARDMPSTPRDYQGIADAMRPLMTSDDMVFVRKRNWADTPLFYHLKDVDYVAEDWAAALAAAPHRRVWLVTWPDEGIPVVDDARRRALAGYRRTLVLERRRASAELFERDAAPR